MRLFALETDTAELQLRGGRVSAPIVELASITFKNWVFRVAHDPVVAVFVHEIHLAFKNSRALLVQL